jgi:predicted anti-sigma-YlaC factor YlaD
VRGRWRSGRAEPPCDTFRQAISSLLDGEQPPLPAKAVAIHLARCEDCRRFQDGAMDLTAKIPLQASRPVPAALVTLLGVAWDTSVGSRPVAPGGRAQARRPRPVWRRRIQWVGALVPAALVVVGLPLGALAVPRAVPSHQVTPCTARLRSLEERGTAP